MNIFKKVLGLAPTLISDGSYIPSPIALMLATSSTTDFDGGMYEHEYKAKKLKILMVCAEENHMVMRNGVKFSTGNHPVEMALPMLHLLKAGFDIDVVTATGGSVKVEMWAMPNKDAAVLKLFDDYKERFENPGKLSDFVEYSLKDDSPYIGIFIPGGHGAMLGLPESKNLAKLLTWVHETDRFNLSICHGPAALIAASLDQENFIYTGYEIAAFPDQVDKLAPLIGYLPGHMPWSFGQKLQDLGLIIINTKDDKTCHVDRKLITGASPKAANNFGRLAATTLLDFVAST